LHFAKFLFLLARVVENPNIKPLKHNYFANYDENTALLFVAL